MKILFCSDGSSPAEKALRFGAPIAAACQAEATVLVVAKKAGDEDALLLALRRAQDIFKEHHLEAEFITKEGRPAHEIVKQTRESHYDLVVIGAVPKSPIRRFFDTLWMSVQAYKLIESIEPPVLVVIGGRTALRRILMCTSGADYRDDAIEFAGQIAQAVKAVVDLFHVMPEKPAMYDDLTLFGEDAAQVLASNSKLGRILRHQRDLLEQFGVFGEIRLRHGEVVPELQQELQRREYDLVMSDASPALMGDVAREIVNSAELPVLVIRTRPKQFTRLFKGLLARVFHRQETQEGAGESE